MKVNKIASSAVLVVATLAILAALQSQLLAGGSAAHSSAGQWSVPVDKVDAGDVSLEPAFRVVNYEK